uniref:Auxin-responsive protein n=1 Tax=Galium aparine TaxID=29788 RepID=A0A896W967_GALAP|nr:IAA27 [Galium aparine]
MSDSAVEQDYIGLSASSSSSNTCPEDEKNRVSILKETELRLGLPGSESPERKIAAPTVLFGKSLGAKRGFSDAIHGSRKWDLSLDNGKDEILLAENGAKGVAVKPSEEKKNAPASKAQVVGWPPIRSFRKNALATNVPKNNDAEAKSGLSCLFVKVSMDGAPYLRKVDLKTYSNYAQLSSALEKLFSCFTIGQPHINSSPLLWTKYSLISLL